LSKLLVLHRRAAPSLIVLAIVALGLALLGAAPTAAAQGAVTMEVTPALEGNYAPDRWLPLSIVLRNDGPPARVTVAAAIPGARARNSASVELAGAGQASVLLYAAMDRQARELVVTLEQDGVAIAEQRVPVRPREGERILGLVSDRPLTLELPRRQDLTALPFLPFALAPAGLPDRPAGLSSFSLLLLNDLPAESLGPAQQDALHAWVRAGGHLVVGGGPGAAGALSVLPPALRLAEAGPATALDPAPLGAYADAEPPAALQGATLAPAPGATPYGAAAAPLWVQQDVGAGRVTQLAFDPGVEALQSWQGAPALWDRLLRPARLYVTLGRDSSAAGIQAQILSGALGNLPPISLPNVQPLFLLLAIYAILIGPGMALLLHRLDRQALGWAMLPAFALGVGAIATGMAVASRADQRIVSQATLVEQIDEDTARALSGLGLLTPRDERFAVAVGGDAVVRPLSPASARFGAIEGAAGALAQDGAALQLEVDRWALQGVYADALVPFPALDAELVVGSEQITARVRNTTGQPLQDVIVVYAGRVARLGDIEAGGDSSAAWPAPTAPGEPRPGATAPVSVLVLGEELAAGNAPGSAPERQLLLREGLINAALAPAQEGEAPGPLVLAWLSESPLPLSADAPGAAVQQVGLLVARPRISGAGPVFLPAGWMQIAQGETPRATCTGPQGVGLAASPGPLTITMALPPELGALRVGDLSLDMQSERPWPNAGVTTELFSWDSGEWVELNFDGPGTISLGNAGQFVEGGRLQARLSGQIEQAGCVFADAALRGELP
jgi:hypothetical protein